MMTKVETQKTCILLIEDNPRDVHLIQEQLLAYSEIPIDLEWVDRLSLGLQRIEKGGVDLVLLDLTLPDSHWLDTFTKLHEKAKDIPVVVLSGVNNKAHALELVKSGAQDYLVKGEVNHDALHRSIRYSLERHKLQKKLHKLYTRIEKNHPHTEELIHIGQQLNSSHNLKEILELSKKTLPFLFQAEFFSIFLLDPKTNELVLATHNHSEWENLQMPFKAVENNSIMWDAIRKHEMIEIKNFSISSYAIPWKKQKV